MCDADLMSDTTSLTEQLITTGRVLTENHRITVRGDGEGAVYLHCSCGWESDGDLDGETLGAVIRIAGDHWRSI